MRNEQFKSAYEKVKSYLAKSLTAENTDEVTSLAKDLDAMKDSMEKEESDHLDTKNKLVDFVKNTSFKSTPEDNPDPVDDSPKTLKEAEEIAMKKLLDNRKNKKGE